MQRREVLPVLGAAAAAGWLPAHAADAAGWNRNAFGAKSLAEVVRALGGATSAESRELTLQAPEIAENGASVRFTLQSKVPGTTLMALVVDKNPFALAGLFEVPPGTDAQFTTHLKMAQTSAVHVLARAGDRWLHATRQVTVTLGGCATS